VNGRRCKGFVVGWKKPEVIRMPMINMDCRNEDMAFSTTAMSEMPTTKRVEVTVKCRANDGVYIQL
jgi:hypothetical protein